MNSEEGWRTTQTQVPAAKGLAVNVNLCSALSVRVGAGRRRGGRRGVYEVHAGILPAHGECAGCCKDGCCDANRHRDLGPTHSSLQELENSHAGLDGGHLHHDHSHLHQPLRKMARSVSIHSSRQF